MSDDAVTIRSNRGQWEVVVPDHPERSRSYASREEAEDAGSALADELGLPHRVIDAEPTGAITDEDDAATSEDDAATR